MDAVSAAYRDVLLALEEAAKSAAEIPPDPDHEMRVEKSSKVALQRVTTLEWYCALFEKGRP